MKGCVETIGSLLIVVFLITMFIPLWGLRHELAANGFIMGESENEWALVLPLLLSIPALIAGVWLLWFTKKNWSEKSTLWKITELTNALVPFPALAIFLFINFNGNSLIKLTLLLCLTALLIALEIVTNIILLIWLETPKSGAKQPL
jgi:hypothetical protein